MSLGMDANKVRESGWWDTAKIIVEALAIAMVVRLFFYQPFSIPSGSMKETLLVGDYLFVSKLSYGYSTYSFTSSFKLFDGRIFASPPERGDVAVFKLPRDNSTDYIKRVIGLPGDEIAVRNGVLFINGAEIPKVRDGSFTTREDGRPPRAIPRFKETLPNGVSHTILKESDDGFANNTPEFVVPAGHYFMMGDNRDNSDDSRYWGFVPDDHIRGRAFFIWFNWDDITSFAFRRVGSGIR